MLRRTFIKIVLWHDCFAKKFSDVILVYTICHRWVLVYADSSSHMTFNTYSTLGFFLRVSPRKLKNPKISLVLYIICSKYENQDGNIFKEEELIEILKVLDLIENI